MSSTMAVWLGCGVTVAAFFLNVILFVKSGAWGMSDRLGTMEGRIMGVIADHQTREAAAAEKIKADFDDKLEFHENRFGETARAMQQKIHEIETWSRDEFVRRHSFEAALTRIEGAMSRIDNKLDQSTADQSKIASAVAALAAKAK